MLEEPAHPTYRADPAHRHWRLQRAWLGPELWKCTSSPVATRCRACPGGPSMTRPVRASRSLWTGSQDQQHPAAIRKPTQGLPFLGLGLHICVMGTNPCTVRFLDFLG